MQLQCCMYVPGVSSHVSIAFAFGARSSKSVSGKTSRTKWARSSKSQTLHEHETAIFTYIRDGFGQYMECLGMVLPASCFGSSYVLGSSVRHTEVPGGCAGAHPRERRETAGRRRVGSTPGDKRHAFGGFGRDKR